MNNLRDKHGKMTSKAQDLMLEFETFISPFIDEHEADFDCDELKIIMYDAINFNILKRS